MRAWEFLRAAWAAAWSKGPAQADVSRLSTDLDDAYARLRLIEELAAGELEHATGDDRALLSRICRIAASSQEAEAVTAELMALAEDGVR